MSAEIAATLHLQAAERRPFIVTAVPRLAGKSTVMRAMLARPPPRMPIWTVSGDAAELRRLVAGSARGYLVIPEISRAPVPSYLWGAPVRRVFRTLSQGFALATALHSAGVEEAFEIVCQGNAVPDEDAARVTLVVYLRSLGEDWRRPTRRVVAAVHEVTGVVDGRPRARLLHRWDEASDRFETVAQPAAAPWREATAELERLARRRVRSATSRDRVAPRSSRRSRRTPS